MSWLGWLGLACWLAAGGAGAAESAPTVQLAWDPNSEPDIGGYRIHFGLGSRYYTFREDVGNVTNATIRLPAIPGMTFFFAATAYTVDGIESDYSNEVTYDLPVQPDDPPPRGMSVVKQIPEDTQAILPLETGTLEAASTTLLVRIPPAHGSMTGDYPEITYVPRPDFHGEENWEVVMYDARAQVVRATLRVVVTPVNDRPRAEGASLELSPNTSVSVLLRGSDVDGDALVYQVVRPPAHGLLSGDPPNLIYTPNPGFEGEDSLTFTVQDGALESAAALVRFVVADQPPVAWDDFVVTTMATPVAIRLSAHDAEDPSLAFVVTEAPSGGRLEGQPPELTYVPNPTFEGEDGFTFSARDSRGQTAFARVWIAVVPPNHAPVAQDQSHTIRANESLELQLVAWDEDDDWLTYLIVEPPVHGQLLGEPPDLIYHPTPGYDGSDRFRFRASDGRAESEAAAVEILILPSEEPTPELVGIRLDGNLVELTWLAQAGATYRVWYKAALEDPAWQPLSEPIVATESPITWRGALPSPVVRGFLTVSVED
ncbi:MAG: tandem-95 repeat protein [Verrucomicrobiales bacterium]|nr:tandem-95 repeat protein [Verrucomicrobiales bacterium]